MKAAKFTEAVILKPGEPGASHHDPVLQVLADGLRTADQPPKVIITAATRKPAPIANVLRKARRRRLINLLGKYSF